MTSIEASATYRLPPSAWAFGWLCLAAQVLALLDRGHSSADAPWVLVSMLLSALVVAWFARGVLTGARGRTAVVYVLLAIGLLLHAFDAIASPSALDWLGLLIALVQLGALMTYTASDDYQAMRRAGGARPEAVEHIGALLVVAVLTGALGGLTADPNGNDSPIQLRVGL